MRVLNEVPAIVNKRINWDEVFDQGLVLFTCPNDFAKESQLKAMRSTAYTRGKARNLEIGTAIITDPEVIGEDQTMGLLIGPREMIDGAPRAVSAPSEPPKPAPPAAPRKKTAKKKLKS